MRTELKDEKVKAGALKRYPWRNSVTLEVDTEVKRALPSNLGSLGTVHESYFYSHTETSGSQKVPIFFLRGHLGMFGDIFGCGNSGKVLGSNRGLQLTCYNTGQTVKHQGVL